MPDTFIERDCTIVHEGKEFESGGSWLADCTDGYRRGVVYVKPADNDINPGQSWRAPLPSCNGIVTTWKGEKIADAQFGARYQGNYCRMRAVSFTVAGVRFTGRYCPDSSQAVRVRSTMKMPAPSSGQ